VTVGSTSPSTTRRPLRTSSRWTASGESFGPPVQPAKGKPATGFVVPQVDE
jgi:hypothetical protein